MSTVILEYTYTKAHTFCFKHLALDVFSRDTFQITIAISGRIKADFIILASLILL